DPADGRRPALDRRALLSQRPARGDRACSPRSQPSGDVSGRACDQERATRVVNDPARSVACLANTIARTGLALEAGQVVLAGSFIRPIETRKGDTIQADYGPYGSVSCYFALCVRDVARERA